VGVGVREGVGVLVGVRVGVGEVVGIAVSQSSTQIDVSSSHTTPNVPSATSR
jgi:hypothetical protein